MLPDGRDPFVANVILVQIERGEMAKVLGDRPGADIAHVIVPQIERGELAEVLGDCGGVRIHQAE